MPDKSAIIQRALDLGFDDIGFTTADPFDSQREVLRQREESYAWIAEKGLDLVGGTDPGKLYPGARSIIVLLENYFRRAFPPSLEGKFGRCYLDDDRVTKEDLALRIRAFIDFLRRSGIDPKVSSSLPHRIAAARAGLGTFGKNCLLYSRRVARQSSWVLPIAILVDREFPPDEPRIEVGCPDWCRNACITACPTGALKGPRHLEPRLCISYLSYYGQGITPLELREPMGIWVYGCDRCQEVCPRNRPWMSQDLPVNSRAAALVEDLQLARLLHMNGEYFKARVWPRMFYMPPGEIWRWQMNAARAIGNSLDPAYVPDLARSLRENPDPRVRGMAAWALGRIGGPEAGKVLESALGMDQGQAGEEILRALERVK
ncbi:MAG: HEAT repeat domain-containing protein [Peptococcaceae bacterium]|nr:HEAT repeat domain-containing protein [Peptococcaceae bacterium]